MLNYFCIIWQICIFKKFLCTRYKFILSNNSFINLKVKIKNSGYWRNFSIAVLKRKWSLVYKSFQISESDCALLSYVLSFFFFLICIISVFKKTTHYLSFNCRVHIGIKKLLAYIDLSRQVSTFLFTSCLFHCNICFM